MRKTKLTVKRLQREAASFSEAESTYPEPTLFGVTDGKAIGTYLVVQRNELSSFPQSFFPGPGVAVAGDSIPLLPPCGQVDHVPLRLRRHFGGEDDLQ